MQTVRKLLSRISDDPRGESSDFQAKIADALNLAQDSSATGDVGASDKMAGKDSAGARETMTTQQPGASQQQGDISTILRRQVRQAEPQPTNFPFLGRLTDSGSAANGNYDCQFALSDALNGGTQIGSTLTRSRVAVTNGEFGVLLDFGVNALTGADRFLEIGVQPAGGGSFTTMSQRLQISAARYGI